MRELADEQNLDDTPLRANASRLPGGSPKTAPEPLAVPQSADAAQLVWRVLSAPRTFALLATLLALVRCATASVPQGLSPAAPLNHTPFPVADAVRASGLADVAGAWPVVSLVILLLLSTLGLLLRFTLLTRLPPGADAPSGAPVTSSPSSPSSPSIMELVRLVAGRLLVALAWLPPLSGRVAR